MQPRRRKEAATRTRLRELKDAGLSRLAVSLDGPDAATHDAFRGVRGSYDWTMKIIQAAVELDLPLQINTTVSRITLPFVEAMARPHKTADFVNLKKVVTLPPVKDVVTLGDDGGARRARRRG